MGLIDRRTVAASLLLAALAASLPAAAMLKEKKKGWQEDAKQWLSERKQEKSAFVIEESELAEEGNGSRKVVRHVKGKEYALAIVLVDELNSIEGEMKELQRLKKAGVRAIDFLEEIFFVVYRGKGRRAFFVQWIPKATTIMVEVDSVKKFKCAFSCLKGAKISVARDDLETLQKHLTETRTVDDLQLLLDTQSGHVYVFDPMKPLDKTAKEHKRLQELIKVLDEKSSEGACCIIF